MQYVPVETLVGILNGRDAIYLDSLRYETGRLTLRGGLTRAGPDHQELPFTLVFVRVEAYRVITLDAWKSQSASSFDKVLNSPWPNQLAQESARGVGSYPEPTRELTHYLVQAYDDVIEVLCRTFELTLGTAASEA